MAWESWEEQETSQNQNAYKKPFLLHTIPLYIGIVIPYLSFENKG
jgi:hypothetical protein